MKARDFLHDTVTGALPVSSKVAAERPSSTAAAATTPASARKELGVLANLTSTGDFLCPL